MQLTRGHRAIPEANRANFRNLYLDIGWFGLLNGSAMAFISIYLVRIGASAFQIGLLNAAPAVMAIALALPAGSWLKNRAIDRAVFRTAVLHRFFYLVWIPLPVLFLNEQQVDIVIAVTFLMSIPGTVLAVGFNAMYADAVPADWRAHVVGVRNALLAAVTIVTSLLCGYVLDHTFFPLNYQVVFTMGVLGAVMSSYHLHRIRLSGGERPRTGRNLGDMAQPGIFRTLGEALRPAVAWRYFTQVRSLRPNGLGILRGPYGWILLSLFLFHLTQYLAIPLFPVYWVEQLSLSDQVISLGNALFFATVFLGSTQIRRLTSHIGHRGVTALGALVMAAYPGLTAITTNVTLFLITSIVGGSAWSLAGGALSNFLLEHIPDADRPNYLAWYMLVANVAVLGGSLLGPELARLIGIVPALVVIAIGRVISAAGIWKLGVSRRA
jgi:predicted MFS family arabinose efflux permease